jgi:hypothetical protein
MKYPQATDYQKLCQALFFTCHAEAAGRRKQKIGFIQNQKA